MLQGCGRKFNLLRIGLIFLGTRLRTCELYRGADKYLARPGRKQATEI
jgi:hypothetical protein